MSEHFWKRCTNFKDLVKPIVYGLCDLYAKMLCMGKVLHIMKKLHKHVFALDQKPFKLVLDIAKLLKKAFKAQRAMVKTILHYAKALLNPYLLHDKELVDN